MITIKGGHYYWRDADAESKSGDDGHTKTMAYKVLSAHNTSGDMGQLKLRFDAMTSHDITYVSIIQTARASGMTRFPIPYVLTNCHNSLCAVGGTINEDDHLFGLSAARKYGGVFVPAHLSVIHQYMRENFFGSGKMVLGSDSHTRLGAFGTLAIGEGGPELVLQLLEKTYDISYPKVVGVYLHGKPTFGVGPHDVALAIIAAVYKGGTVKNAIMEFVGPGISGLSMDFRNGIDVMTTETTCLSSIWETDEKTVRYAAVHNIPGACTVASPDDGAYYDGWIDVDLSAVKPMIALPYHPSNAIPIEDFKRDPREALRDLQIGNSNIRDGKFYVDQAVIAGCAGGSFENIILASRILGMRPAEYNPLQLSVYPASQPIYIELMKRGIAESLLRSGAVMRSAICGPCFGAGDVPANGAFSVRHTTRNFPNREGSKPADGQSAYVALMDARSIAATVLNGGALTAATELDLDERGIPEYHYDDTPYRGRVYQGFSNAIPDEALRFGPNIADWPDFPELAENLLLKVASALYDEVTTTDELIPSGETSSLRSNPVKLAQYTLSRRDPEYVGRARETAELEQARKYMAEKGEEAETDAEVPGGACALNDGTAAYLLSLTGRAPGEAARDTAIGSVLFAKKPGDGSAREQAASCQRVLGGSANIAADYATKRYRGNVVNWGMLPFILDGATEYGIEAGDIVYIPDIRSRLDSGAEDFGSILYRTGRPPEKITLRLPRITRHERDIILAGCLINYYARTQ